MATTVFNRTPPRGWWRILIAGLVASVACTTHAQIQQAWVARYNNGITNGTNQAIKMTLDAGGNIYVTGFSQNTNANLGYATIKYVPNGNQLWAARYDSTNSSLATPVGLVLDNSNNVIVTGTALTIKYDTNGNQLWTAPYAGSSLAVDNNGNVGVTGFGTSFNTVKLGPSGSNLWLQTFPSPCETVLGQVVVSDTNGNFYVAGSYPTSCENGIVDYELLLIKYSGNGSQMWTSTYVAIGAFAQVAAVVLDGTGNIYGDVNFLNVQPYTVLKWDLSGSLTWSSSLNQSAVSASHGLVIDRNSNVIFTGQIPYQFTGFFSFTYGTFKVNANGAAVWTNNYPQPPFGSSVASAIAVDSGNNCYVTGYSPGSNFLNDIVTIKYDPSGNQVWLQRYNGPDNGNAAGNAIAVDNNGNVYVAGYDTTAAGGTEMVLIKYSPVTLQSKPDGTVLLETQGSPGESFDIEASIDLLNWLDLGTVLADTNGLMMFDDTNAPQYNSRFYYTKPQ
jgi:Beta-propeller repeat